MDKNISYYMSLKYNIEVEYIESDHYWIAYHPELGRGVCFAEANSPARAIKLLDNNRLDLFELLLSEDIPIKEPDKTEESPSGQILLRVPKSLHKSIKEYSKIEGISANQFISTLIAEGIGRIASKTQSIEDHYILSSSNDKDIMNKVDIFDYRDRGLHSSWNLVEAEREEIDAALDYKRDGTYG